MDRVRVEMSGVTKEWIDKISGLLGKREKEAVFALAPCEDQQSGNSPRGCDNFDLMLVSGMDMQTGAILKEMNFILVQSIGYQEVCRLISQADRDADRAILEIIDSMCLRIGVPAHIQGYQYIREGVRIVCGRPDIINGITKALYPSIAARYDTSPSKVERSIRHAISLVWSRGRVEALNELFGFTVCTADNRPTNGEFIALLANRCRAAK